MAELTEEKLVALRKALKTLAAQKEAKEAKQQAIKEEKEQRRDRAANMYGSPNAKRNNMRYQDYRDAHRVPTQHLAPLTAKPKLTKGESHRHIAIKKSVLKRTKFYIPKNGYLVHVSQFPRG